MYKSKWGAFNEPRNAAIYLMRKLRRDSLVAIGERFKMEKYSSVSSIIEGTKRRMKKDRNLKERIGNLHSAVLKSHEQN